MKKALHYLYSIFVGLVVVFAVSMMIFTIVSVRTLNSHERNLFGYKAYIVLSDSMSATDFDSGDVILCKEVDPGTLEAGDIIAYLSRNSENYGEVVTHKIRSLTTDENGNPGFITYGTTTDVDDEKIVTYSAVLGKYQTALPKIGTFFSYLKTPIGYFLFIFTPFMLLIIMQGIQCVKLFRQYKREQEEELKAEREQIASERAENQRLLDELKQLKEEMNYQTP